MASDDNPHNFRVSGCGSSVQYCSSEKEKRPGQHSSGSDDPTSELTRNRIGAGSLSSDKTIEDYDNNNSSSSNNNNSNNQSTTAVVVVPRELQFFVETSVEAQELRRRQEENVRLVAWRIERLRQYRPWEQEEERRRGVSTRLELFSDQWKVKKRLTPSDLGNLSRILIQTHLVETHVKPYMVRAGVFDQVLTRQGLRVFVWDVDTDTVHTLVFKKWATSRSFIFIGSWTPEFVHRRQLKEEDEVGFLWDPYTPRFFFKVLSRSPNPNLNP